MTETLADDEAGFSKYNAPKVRGCFFETCSRQTRLKLSQSAAITLQINREVKRSVSNGEILRYLTTYLCCVDPYSQSQQQHKIDNFWNKAK